MNNIPKFFLHKNWTFVSYEYAGGGHRLGRKICCLPKFLWYSTAGNGKRPWNVSSWRSLPDGNFLKNIRTIASAHYAQMGPYGILPFDYSIGKEWIPDKSMYYSEFSKQFLRANGPTLLDAYKIAYVSHSMPDEILQTFPNAKIINLVDDPVKLTNRYMHTTAIFPGNLSTGFKWIKDLEYTEAYRKHKLIEETFYPNYTLRDVWSYDNFNTMWDDSYKELYYQEVYNKISSNVTYRQSINHKNVLTVTKNKTKEIKEFLLGN
jgi:hypothetical protein